ncbi:MAG: lipoprotein LpqH [Candidatus Sericytochromatia bacterium]
MGIRPASAATVVALLLVTGCSSQEIRSQANASVTIDGKDQGKTQDVRCNQLQSSWFLDIRQVGSTATAIVDLQGDKAQVQTVDIQGFGGFTGSYWQGGDQTADATFTNQTFTISGTASGVKTGNPRPSPVTFKIVAKC